MSAFDYDLFVIGAGSGGVRAARVAAQGGAKVAIAEEHRFGGTCVIRGCVPKKLLVYASQFAEHHHASKGFGWSGDAPEFDWPTLIRNKDTEIARLEGLYRANLEKAGVDIFQTRATVEDPHTVRLMNHGRTARAKHILVATGGAPFVPDFPGSLHVKTSNEVFDLEHLPKQVIVVGGGYIAVEFAGIFNGLGADVSLAYRGPLFLRGFDQDVREHLAEEMRAKGIDLLFNADIARIEESGDQYEVHFTNGDVREAGLVVSATGRVPNTEGLGLENAGVVLSPRGAVVVDDYSQTNIPSIYAVGDVTDRVALTPVAIREGMAFVETVFNGNPTSPDHELIPTAVFSQPEIGTIGLTEEEARELYDVEIYRAKFRPMRNTLSGESERMLMKLIVDKASRRVLGVHIMGHAAGEMIQCLGIAVKMGATKEDFDRTMAVHPTAAEELVTMREPVA